MAYQTLIDADSIGSFQEASPAIDDLPSGTKIKLRIELPWWAPIGKLADLATAEWWAEQFLEADVRVVDVYGNWHWIEIKGVVRGTPVLLLIAIIVVALSALGISWFISRIILDADIPSVAKAGLGLLLIAGVALAGFTLLSRRRT